MLDGESGPEGLEQLFLLACELSKEDNSATFLDIKHVGKVSVISSCGKGRKGINAAFAPLKRVLPT